MAIENAKACQTRLRKLLAQVPRAAARAEEVRDTTLFLLDCILEADTTPKEAVAARTALVSSFLDLNELRVATPREITDCWKEDFPGAQEKAEIILRVLNAIFDRTYQMGLEYLKKVPRKEIRKALLALGAGPYASARVLLGYFGVPAIPVDASLLETLQMEGHVPPGATIEEVQGLLEKIVPPRSAADAHAFLRAYVEKHAKALAAKRKKDAQEAARQARLAEQARAKAQAEQEAAEKAAREAAARAARKRPASAAKSPPAKPQPRKADRRREPGGKRKD